MRGGCLPVKKEKRLMDYQHRKEKRANDGLLDRLMTRHGGSEYYAVVQRNTWWI